MQLDHRLADMIAMRDQWDFIAIDFETATYQMDSACSIGIAAVRDRQVITSVHFLIQPPGNRYSQFNIDIHGIFPEETEFSPPFFELWPHILPLFTGCPVLAHNARFDMGVLLASLGPQALSLTPNFTYLDTLQMVKGIVPGRRNLAACSAHFCIPLSHHHNAEADAIACAQIAIACLSRLGAGSLSDFCRLSPGTHQYQLHSLSATTTEQRAFSPRQRQSFASFVNPKDIQASHTDFDAGHPLFQKIIVFTGELCIPRRDAMQLAVDSGALLRSSVSKKTDFLVVGKADSSLVGQSGLSGKEAKARALLSAGHGKLHILDERAFLQLVYFTSDPQVARR